MKSIRIAVYTAISIHFLRSLARKVLEPPRKHPLDSGQDTVCMHGTDIEKLLLEGLEWEIEREIDKTAKRPAHPQGTTSRQTTGRISSRSTFRRRTADWGWEED